MMVATQHLGLGCAMTTCAFNRTRGVPLAERVMTAETLDDRRMGLLNRPALRPGEALHIVPCDSIHTVGMRYAIDVVFLDENGVVLATWRNVQPGRMGIRCDRAVSALELLAGTLDAAKFTQARDIIEFQEVPC